MHTSVVSLVERFADLRKRYGGEKPGQDVVRRITELENETYEIEKKIFSKLDFSPEELAQLLNKTFLARDHYRHKGWH